jgi:predicted amidohydrolase YtcJ
MKQVIFGGKVYLSRGKFAQALLIDGERIVAAGDNGEILSRAGTGAARIDAQGRLVLPGFYDSHLHLLDLGRQFRMIDLSGVASTDELVEQGRRAVERLKPPEGAVLSGFGLNEEKFAGKRLPTREDLDRISTRHGLIIARVCGHTVICNSRVLEMAGIAESAPPVEGGRIDTDGTGRPTGILREAAAARARRLIPPPTDREIRENLEYAMTSAASRGLTSAASFDTRGPDLQRVIDAYCGVYRSGASRLRVTMQAGILEDAACLDEWLRSGCTTGRVLYDPYLKMGPLKLFADGTLGSRTAWMRRPYWDDPGNTGVPVMDRPALAGLIKKADAGGMQVAVHVIGDAALDLALECYEALTPAAGGGGLNPRRHGVIHCQITTPALLERMKRRGVLALVQPIFLARDLYIVEKRVGKDLAATSYAWGSMDRLGVPAAYGTDSPVESVDPLRGIACAVTRKDPEADFPPGGFCPGERVDVYTAVDNYTAGSAYANFDEDRLGRIRPGYLADLVLLDRDIFAIPPEEILKTRVSATLVGGALVSGAI